MADRMGDEYEIVFLGSLKLVTYKCTKSESFHHLSGFHDNLEDKNTVKFIMSLFNQVKKIH